MQNENRVPVFIDGALESLPSWQGYAGSSTRTYLDPDLISSVEVQKGVSFGADGVGATGGVVRMSTITHKDIILDGEDIGFKISGGTMSNTIKKPELYTRGGYRTKWIDGWDDYNDCIKDDSGNCIKQTYDTPARYKNNNKFGRSFNGSLAFAKKWENADIVLGYAKKKQGNYFAGKRGKNTPKIIGYETSNRGQVGTADDGKPITHNPNLTTDISDTGDIDGVNFWPVYDKNTGLPTGKFDFAFPEYKAITKALVFDKRNYSYYRPKEEVLNTFQDNQSLLAKFNTYNDEHSFNLTYIGYKSNFGELMQSQSSIRSDGALQNDGTFVKVDTFSTKYSYNPLSNQYVNFNITAYHTKIDSSFYMAFVEDLMDYNFKGVKYSPSDARYAYFMISNQNGINLSNTSILMLNNRPLKLNYGVSFSSEKFSQPKDIDDRLKSKGYPYSTSLIELAQMIAKKRGRDPSKVAIRTNSAAGDLLKRHAKRTETSSFIWANYSPVDWLITDFAVRYTTTKTKDYMPLYIQPGSLGNNSNKTKIEYSQAIKQSAISPMFMLTLKPIEEISIYAKYAEASRNPSLFQATRGFSQTSAVGSELSKLKPERQKNIEIGTNILLDDIFGSKNVFGFRFAFFNNYTKDYLTRSNILVTRQSNQDVIMQTANIKSALYRGLESSLYFDMGGFYAQVGANRMLKTRFCRNSDECFSGGLKTSNLSNSIPPKFTLFTTIGTRLFANKLDMGLRHSYYSKRFVSVSSGETESGNTTSVDWDAYSVVDLYASYEPIKNLTLLLAVDNVMDRYYLDANSMSFTPAPGRTIRLNFSYKF